MRTVALVAAATVAATGCGGGKKGPSGPPPLAVEVGKVSEQNLATYATLDGQIEPLLESQLSSPQSGNVVAVYVHEGDRVHSGQLLAKLDDSQLRSQLEGNIAAASQAAARLNSSNIQLPINSQTYNSGLQNAQNVLTGAQAALRNALVVYNSDLDLYPKGYVARTTLERDRAAYAAAQRDVLNAQAALAQARQNMQSTGVDRATVAANRAALDQANANVRLLQTQVDQSSIIAPFDGVVTARLLDPGAFAAPNQPVVRVSQLDPVYVTFNVPDDILSYVHHGTNVSFATSSLANRAFSGVVQEINATPTQGTLSYRARIVERNPDDALRGGMLVSVKIRQEYRPNA